MINVRVSKSDSHANEMKQKRKKKREKLFTTRFISDMHAKNKRSGLFLSSRRVHFADAINYAYEY